MPRRVLRFIRGHDLLLPGQTVVVGVSGGPDSVCLLHLLASLSAELSIHLHAAHLNHLLRDADSSADARYVSDLAGALGVPATVDSRDVRAYQAAHRRSLEEAAREVRYAFLAEVAMTVGAARVAVGHTADDQVETVLLHFLRGAGTGGLRGMAPAAEWRFTATGTTLPLVRPLLDVTRLETGGYCAEHRLSPRQDLSNLSPSLLRNRVRWELLPLLVNFNRNVKEVLRRAGRLAVDDFAFIGAEAERVRDSVEQETGGAITFDTGSMLALHPALQRYLLRDAAQRILGHMRDFEAVHIEDMMAMLRKPVGTRLALPHNLEFTAGYGECTLAPRTPAQAGAPPPEERPLVVPGETALPGWRVLARIADYAPAGADPYRACFDLEAVGDELTVRSRRAGDRFQPLGLAQPKKLQDFMVDAKIPRARRDGVPLVCSAGRIIWVVGWRVSEWGKLLPGTKRFLCLEFSRT